MKDFQERLFRPALRRPGGLSFFLQIMMIFPARIFNPILIALAVLFAGCASVPRPASNGHRGLSFSIVAPDARTVSVAGSFNRWDPDSRPLSGPDRFGRWAITIDLPPGRYEYLFVIDGREWVLDPAAPSVDNGLDGRNSIVTATGDPSGVQ